MPQYAPGSLVACREREWVVLPSESSDVLLLRPIGGGEAEICGIYLPLEGDTVRPATFALPQPEQAGDFVSGRLLRDAARLTLRSGAGPFRSLGRLAVRPRPYQLVPLIMALRLNPVRLLIADDVGIGKTIEAGLIARELLDRAEIRRMTILCPPHLCDQWQRELAEKFAIEATIVRASTAAALERSLPRGDVSVFEHFPFTIASIDYLKSERRRETFLRTCPELVIVDEAHTATMATGRDTGQQQRHELIRELAANPQRHVLLLTATPHSGLEDAFRSLIGLLDERFQQFDPANLREPERDLLARHFVQRRRADVQRWLGEDTPFPSRDSAEVTFSLPLKSEYRSLFDEVYAFTRELVQTSLQGTATRSWQQRARYWAALALLRCVMSSPAAAEQALRIRAERAANAEEPSDPAQADALFSPYVGDPTDLETAIDQEPAHVVEQGSASSDRGRLLRFASRARALRGDGDPKLQKLVRMLEELLRAGYNPIVFCRYIATANYLAQELEPRLRKAAEKLRVLAVTGERSEEERETLIAELSAAPRRLLIATDCVSEGINLQDAFDAVIHYDLPWNPNRLEQREGRVDRYGQRNPSVRCAILYGQDNPMDEAVMRVLLRKAVAIHRTLGISIPLPVENSTVVDTLIESLFVPKARQESLFEQDEQFDQLTLLDAEQRVREIEIAWDRASEREKESRTRFAQRRIHPEEVARELEESDAILGDATTVQRFVLAACERLNVPLTVAPGRVSLHPSPPAPLPPGERGATQLPNMDSPLSRTWERGLGGEGKQRSSEPTYTLEASAFPATLTDLKARVLGNASRLQFGFGQLPQERMDLIGRNHRLTIGLAEYLLEQALETGIPAPAARSGLIRSAAVSRRTILLLLRMRMVIDAAQQPLLAEELLVTGLSRTAGQREWLNEPDALALLATAQPAANVQPDERTSGLQSALSLIAELGDDLQQLANQRAEQLREAHQRVRSATAGGRVRVQVSGVPDVLGVYVLMPNL
jgi:superfamily II DNA or RNA helicase